MNEYIVIDQRKTPIGLVKRATRPFLVRREGALGSRAIVGRYETRQQANARARALNLRAEG